MSDTRPDPDRLLDQIKQEEARQQRGKLKIFFGASAGVGKTYAMLSAARQQLLQGTDVVIGVVETHGRLETEVMADGIDRLPLRDTEYQGRTLKEFDLDAALLRKPTVVIVDELAHTNVLGSRHPKRWQDVEELLAAGIDVWTAINVQHLETLNDVVSGITGVAIRETVPDSVFDLADEVVLVDLPPDELLQRLKDGKVYLPQQAERAIQNFFRKGNLIALRELSLRRTADRVDEQMQQYRRAENTAPIWQTRPSLLACIDADDEGERVIRSTARMAGQLDVPWHAIHVETLEEANGETPRQKRALALLKLAETLGAETASLAATDIPATVVKYARDHNLTRILIGRREQTDSSLWQRLRRLWQATLNERLATLAPDLDITQVARIDTLPARKLEETPDTANPDWSAYAKTVGACVFTAVLATPLHTIFELTNIVMLFLLTVVLVAVRYGRGPSVLACFLSVAIFDFFFVAPKLSFAVSDVQYVLTFIVMLLVGLITGQLTARYRAQATVASRREERVRALYEMSRDLSGALMPEQIAEICQRFVSTEFSARSALLLAGDDDKLQAPVAADKLPPIDHGIAVWAYEHNSAAGFGTDTLPGSPVLYLPLQAPMRLRGVLAIEPSQPERLQSPELRRLLDTCARLVGIALERIHYVNVAQSTTVQMESELLRNSLLSAISHDLRTPLSVLVGLAESISMTTPPPAPEQQRIATAMREESLRMSALVNNLLDMARLQAGQVKLNREWQPVEEVIGSSLGAVHTQLADRHIHTAIAADLPLVEFDAVLVERVLCNLLENAAKYTPAGSHIEIGAALTSISGGRSAMRLWIEDDGPGLPKGKEIEIFEKFARGEKESATPGVGLGLAICRAIVEAHGGTIWAENRKDGEHGARFSFTLPCGTPPQIPVTDL
jgi:two-component system sensor histidine kinase KdpD